MYSRYVKFVKILTNKTPKYIHLLSPFIGGETAFLGLSCFAVDTFAALAFRRGRQRKSAGHPVGRLYCAGIRWFRRFLKCSCGGDGVWRLFLLRKSPLFFSHGRCGWQWFWRRSFWPALYGQPFWRPLPLPVRPPPPAPSRAFPAVPALGRMAFLSVTSFRIQR